MADNITLSAGTADGAVLMTDQDASAPNAHAQIIKLAFGALNTFTLVASGSGLPVVQDGTWTVGLSAGTNTNEIVGDVAQDAGVAGNPVLVGARASTAAPTDMSADGDSVYLWATRKGALNIADAGGSITVDNGGTFAVQATLQASTATTEVVGDAAHDAGAAGNPLLMGAYAKAAAPTDVSADGDAVNLWALRNGALAVNVTAAGALVGGDATNGLDVDVTRVSGNVTVVQATATNLKVDASGVAVPVTDNSGSLTVDNGGTFVVQNRPEASGGLSIFRSLDLDETEEEVSSAACQVYGWFLANTATSTRFLKFYNATAANTTVGTTTPVLTFPLPGNTNDDVAANSMGGHGISFGTALSVAVTSALADNDTTAPAANDFVCNLFYK